MAAVVHSKSGEQDSFVPQFGMVPVPAEFREFLHQAYGIEPHVKAYFNHQEPNRSNLSMFFSFSFLN